MKKIDSNENYVSNDNSSVDEFQYFKAEEYYSNEHGSSGNEDFIVDEVSSGEEEKVSQTETDLDSKNLEKEIEQSSGAESTSAASSNASHVVAESGAAVSGATAGATVTGAVVVIAIVSTSAIINIGIKQKETNIGDNYIALTYNFDSFEKADKEFGVENRDYRIKLSYPDDNYVKELPAVEGEHTYLFPNLKPNTEYKTELIAYSSSASATSKYIDTSFTTKENSDITAIYDEFESYVSYDDEYRVFTYAPAVYFSDSKRSASNYWLTLSNDKGYMETTYEISNDNYIIVPFEHLSSPNISLSAYAEINGEEVLLLTKNIEIEIPSSWNDPSYKKFSIIDTPTHKESVKYINIAGSCVDRTSQDELLVCEVSYYASNGELIDKTNEFLSFDDNHANFELECRVPYGLSNYKYDIYSINENQSYDFREVYYESELISYSLDQNYFGANMTTPMPGEDGFDIQVFDDEDAIRLTIYTQFEFIDNFDDTYYYNIYILSVKTNEIIVESTHLTGPAVTLPSFGVNTTFKVAYEKVSSFSNEDIVINKVDLDTYFYIELPTGTFSNELTYKDGMFYFDYNCYVPNSVEFCEIQAVITYGSSSSDYFALHWDLSNGLVGEIALEGLPTNFIGAVTIEYQFVFSAYPHSSYSVITVDTITYRIDNTIDVNEIMIDIKNPVAGIYGSYNVENDINIYAPGLSLVVGDEYGSQFYNSDSPEKNFSFIYNKGNSNQIVYSLVNPIDNSIVLSKSFDFAEPSTNDTSFSCTRPNPGDSLVTYNEDDPYLINVYRLTQFDSSLYPRVSYSAGIYTEVTYDDNGVASYNFSYREFVTDSISIIKNLPRQLFNGFYYEFRYQPDLSIPVYYIIDTETPSGGLEFNPPQYSYEEIETNDGVNYRLDIYNNGIIDQYLYFNDATYEFDDYLGNDLQLYTFTSSFDLRGMPFSIDMNNYYNYNVVSYLEANNINLEGDIYLRAELVIF